MTSLFRNYFLGTNIYGKFKVYDNPLGLENADVYFQRDLKVDGTTTLYDTSIKNNLIIGTQTTSTDSSGNSIISTSGGDITIRGIIYSDYLTGQLLTKADISYVDAKFNSILGGTLDTTLDTLLEITNYLQQSDNSITTNLTNLISSKLSQSDGDQRYAPINSVPSLNGYVTLNYLLENFYQMDSVYTKVESNNRFALISSIPSLTGYATETFIDTNYYPKTLIYTKTESDARYALVNSIPSLNGYATLTYLQTNYYQKSSLYTKTESDARYAPINSVPSLNGYATLNYLQSNFYSMDSVYTKIETNNLLTSYITSSSLTTTLSNYITSSSLTTALSDYDVGVTNHMNRLSNAIDLKADISNPTFTGTLNAENVAISNTLSLSNIAEFTPNIVNSYSFPQAQMDTNTSEINAGSMTVTNMKKTITFSTPISKIRSFYNLITVENTTVEIEDRLTSLTYTVLKNGSTFATGTCSRTDTFPKIIQISVPAQTFPRTYEVYMTNASFSFTPTFESTSAVYTFVLSIGYLTTPIISNSSNTFVFLKDSYYANSSQSGSNITLSTGSPGSNYSVGGYSLSDSYLTGSGTSKFNEVITNSMNCQDTITSDGQITTDRFNYTSLSGPGQFGFYAYVCAVNTYGFSIPCYCSVKSLETGTTRNLIKWGILLPHHRIRFYTTEANYTSNTAPFTVSNTTSNIMYVNLTGTSYINNTTSFRLYKLTYGTLGVWSEITITNIS